MTMPVESVCHLAVLIDKLEVLPAEVIDDCVHVHLFIDIKIHVKQFKN